MMFGDYTITYGAPFWKPNQGVLIEDNGNAKWLLTNKQIMEEGLEQLRLRSAWHINSTQGSSRGGRGSVDEPQTIDTPHLLPSQVVHLDIPYDDMYTVKRTWRFEDNTHIWIDHTSRLYGFLRFYPEMHSHMKIFVLQISNDKWERKYREFDWTVNSHCNHTDKVSIDLSLLKQQLALCSQLKKFCIQTTISLRESTGRRIYTSCELGLVGVLYNRPQVQLHLQGLADAASSVGEALVEGGQETITDQDNYRGQLENAQNDRAWDREIH